MRFFQIVSLFLSSSLLVTSLPVNFQKSDNSPSKWHIDGDNEEYLQKRIFTAIPFIGAGIGSIVKTIKDKYFPADDSLKCVLDYATRLKEYPTVEKPTFYRECCFAGDYTSVDVGQHNMVETWNDQISGIVIPPGFKATLFKDADLQGDKLELSDIGVTCLATWPGGWNDAVSSIKIEKI